MPLASADPRRLTKPELLKAGLLSGWFFLTITILWLLKTIRSASLLAHLGASELPYVRFGAIVAVAVVVVVYSRVVNRLSRLAVGVGANLLFSAVVAIFSVSLKLGGEALGSQRWFVWAVFILVDVYSTVMVGIFWTYTNDVCSRAEADRIYGPIGLGGILGGVVGGAVVDTFIETLGPTNVLMLCAIIGVACAGIVVAGERILKPPRREPADDGGALDAALEGAREIAKSPYLLAMVGIVVCYEFAAALTDFVINVIIERSFQGEVAIAQMFGRLGWIVSGAALASQLVVVPLLLPRKRAALLVPPVAMGLATVGLAIVPTVAAAVALAAADRGLNYSLQQVTKETLYVPLSDAQKYKAKALIDMFVDRTGKVLSSLALMAILAVEGVSIRVTLAAALGALAIWAVCANMLGQAYGRLTAKRRVLAEQHAALATVPSTVNAPARASRPGPDSPDPGG